MNKYHNRRAELDGYMFDSQRELDRYVELKLLQAAGEIEGLTIHPRFDIEIDGKHVCGYIADFEYTEKGQRVVEDVKGMRTAVYVLKKRLMKVVHDIDIVEIQ